MTNNYERSEHYYDYDRNDLNRPNPFTKVLVVNDDGIVTLPQELLDISGWKEGDDIEFTDMKDGSFQMRKVSEYK